MWNGWDGYIPKTRDPNFKPRRAKCYMFKTEGYDKGQPSPPFVPQGNYHDPYQGPTKIWHAQEEGKSWMEGRSAITSAEPHNVMPINRRNWTVVFRWQGINAPGSRLISDGGFLHTTNPNAEEKAKEFMRKWVEEGDMPWELWDKFV